jgi:putative ABC transport system permease protein
MLQLQLFKEGLMFAIHSVVVNKLRTLLTLLGLTIGIFAIISVFTVLDWMEKSVRDSIATLGDNVVYIDKWPWMPTADFAWWDIIKWPVPTMEEYEQVKSRSEKAEAVAFSLYATRNVKYQGNMAESVLLWIISYDFDKIRSFELEKGRYFSQFEANSGRPVAIIGFELANKLFENLDPIGKEITIAGRKLMVIGVTKKEGTGGISDDGLDNIVLLPVNYVRNLVNIRDDGLRPNIMVKAKTGVALDELNEELRSIMRSTRRLKPTTKDNFTLNRASIVAQGVQAIFSMINIGGAIIGMFSILVGGFGIANIMFVSVKERTNIIGIQKALGAKRRFILGQFLYESFILSIMGGIIGLILIFIATLIVNKLWDWNITLTIGNIVLGLSISGIVGIISGYAPALSASRLDPVKAITSTF